MAIVNDKAADQDGGGREDEHIKICRPGIVIDVITM